MAEGLLYHYPQRHTRKKSQPGHRSHVQIIDCRTWRPLNALRISQSDWVSLMGPSFLVSSADQGMFFLDCANSFMDCALLSRADFGFIALSAIVPVVGPSRRSMGQASTSTTLFPRIEGTL
jgi:hypothetical protein